MAYFNVLETFYLCKIVLCGMCVCIPARVESKSYQVNVIKSEMTLNTLSLLSFSLSIYWPVNESISSDAGSRSAVGSATDSKSKGPGFNTRSGHLLLFLLPLTQEGHLSVTGERICT